MKALLLSIAIGLSALLPLEAQSVSRTNVPPAITVNWGQVTSTNTIVNYNVYLGNASGNYTNVTAAGVVSSKQLLNVTRGTVGTWYWIAVTAVDSGGLESLYSAEPAPVFVRPLPPTPTGVTATAL